MKWLKILAILIPYDNSKINYHLFINPVFFKISIDSLYQNKSKVILFISFEAD